MKESSGYPEQAEDIAVGMVESRRDGSLVTELVIENLGRQPLGSSYDNSYDKGYDKSYDKSYGWRLYFSLGLRPHPDESQLRQVLLDGRYGYLEPTEDWMPLAPGESRSIRVENWLFAGMLLVARQGFHVARVGLDGKQEKLLGSPIERPPVLADTRLENPQVTALSPSCDTRVMTPELAFLLNEKALNEETLNEETLNGKALGTGSPPATHPWQTPLLKTPLLKTLLLKTPLLKTTVPAVKSASFGSPVHGKEDLEKDSFPVTGFVVVTDTCPEEADYIRRYLTEQHLATDVASGADVPLQLAINEQTPQGGYQLTSKPEGVQLLAASREGIFNGLQTFIQLLTRHGDETRLRQATITDQPDLEHRGLFIDIARHFQTPRQIKKLIRAMALYKLNRLQLGICNDEGWRLEIPGISELTDIGSKRGFMAAGSSPSRLYPAWGDNHEITEGYISRQEFIDLLAFAARHHVEIIVEFNMPGHANAIIRSLEGAASKKASRYQLTDPDDKSSHCSAQGYRRNVVNPCMPDTWRFAADVLREIKACYDEAALPMKRVHLGGDELPEGAWLGSPACQGSSVWQPEWDMSKVEDRRAATAALCRHWFAEINRVANSVVPGVEVGFWHEMSASAETTAPDPESPSANCWFNVWATEAGQDDIIKGVLGRGQKLVISNASHLYLDMPHALHRDEPGLPWAGYISARRIYGFDPLGWLGLEREDAAKAGTGKLESRRRDQVAGMQAQLWSETIFTPELMDYHLFPRLLAFAERCWNASPQPGNWPGFAGRVGLQELDRLASLDIHFRIPPPGLKVTDGQVAANVAWPGLEVRYTTEGSEPNQRSQLYEAPLPLTDAMRFCSVHPATGRCSAA